MALLLGCGGDEAPDRLVSAEGEGTSFTRAAAAPADAPAPVAARADATPAGRWLTARLRRPVLLRAAPRGRRLARLGTRTEFGSPRVLGVLRRRPGWLAVQAPELANGRVGWIPAASTRLGATDVSVRLDRGRRRLSLRVAGRTVRAFPVAVGRPGSPTPLGRFSVTDKLLPTNPGSPYGCCALALTGHQTKLDPGWPGGDRLAVHGTPLPETIGRAASLGCMRADEGDLRALLRRVPLGAPLFVRA